MRSLVAVWCLLVSISAWADAKHANPFLSQSKVFFTQGEGEKCLKRLLQAEKWKFNDKKDRAEIEMYGGMCGYLQGETQAAEVSFKRAVEYYPKIELPAEASPGIAVVWAKATGKAVKPEVAAAAAAADDKAKAAAAAKTHDAPVVAKTEAPPVLEPAARVDPELSVNAAPQKKGRSFLLPVLFGGGAVVSAGVGVYLGLTAKTHAAQFVDPNTFQSDADKIAPQARSEALGANIAFGIAGAFAVTALLFLIFGG